MRSRRRRLLAFGATVAILGSVFPAAATAAPPVAVSFTILHTNDFHGQLEASNSDPNKASTPGVARLANVVKTIRTAKGAANTLLVDAGDEMQGSLLSNLGDGTATGKGIPTIDAFNTLGYDFATFGNHEFDWGQVNLANRTTQATYGFLTANIVKNDTGNCSTASWQKPDFADAAWAVKQVGSAPNTVKVGFIGVTTTETPTITVATATAGLCFKDPADSILHYYDEIKAAGADVIVVLSHLGYPDGGYGYGIPVYGDQTLAGKLNTAAKPVNLIIGGHSHSTLTAPGTKVGNTVIAQAAYNGRRVGEADVTVGTDGSVSVDWKQVYWRQQNTTSDPPPSNWKLQTYAGSVQTADFLDATKDPQLDTLVTSYTTNAAYVSLVNQPIGYSAVDLPRNGGVTDNMMGTFIDDAIYGYLNSDGDATNDIDLFFNNAGGIRTDWCLNAGAWSSTAADCHAGSHAPTLLTYGHMFTVLPFGNATVVGQMTGAQIKQVLDQAPLTSNGVIQPAGLKFKYFAYKKDDVTSTAVPPTKRTYAWGAFDYCIVNKSTHGCDPIDLDRTYKVGTNEFLAPAGGDNYSAFKYMTNITYWGDMLNAVNAYVTTHYGTAATAYAGPNGDGTLDGRITRDGTDAPDSGTVVPLTILHHNDSHGNLVKGTFVGYAQLATLIKQERTYNPTRTLLLDGGDAIQGDAMMYYFKSAPSGAAADGTALDPAIWTHPMMAALNAMNYDAFVLGNHEFNFGSVVFKGIFNQATFPILGANVTDTGAYGLASAQGGVGVKPSITKTMDGIKVAILGITNHRVPNYELPSNILGLAFQNPIDTGKALAPALKASNDVVIALTHIGFTTNPKSVEVDANVDTAFAGQVPGIDAVIGSHSHTNPAAPEAPYKFLPAIIKGTTGQPVIVNQAYRYNNTLGEVIIGVRPKAGGGYEVVSQVGTYLSVQTTAVEDAATKALLAPYVTALAAYNAKAVGKTTIPIDTLAAFTQETNGANLQADASIFELAKHGIRVDAHLSGAMTNKLVAAAATQAAPVSMTIADMFAAMPYENSLVVMKMNGPQIKAILERAYRNYYYYKYVTGYGGYSYYTTCMIDTDKLGKITYNDASNASGPLPYDPSRSYVKSFTIDGRPVDFNDASTFYRISTVNYLAAGSCNFNDGGVSLWPLNQIVNDTQYYVRDAVIDYMAQMGTVSPTIEGRLEFVTGDLTPPTVSIASPAGTSYLHNGRVTPRAAAADDNSGIASLSATLDGKALTLGRTLDLRAYKLGTHTLAVTAKDVAGNTTTKTVSFRVIASMSSLAGTVKLYRTEGKVTKAFANRLLARLASANRYVARGSWRAAIGELSEFNLALRWQSGHAIRSSAATLLTDDCIYVQKTLRGITASVRL